MKSYPSILRALTLLVLFSSCTQRLYSGREKVRVKREIPESEKSEILIQHLNENSIAKADGEKTVARLNSSKLEEKAKSEMLKDLKKSEGKNHHHKIKSTRKVNPNKLNYRESFKHLKQIQKQNQALGNDQELGDILCAIGLVAIILSVILIILTHGLIFTFPWFIFVIPAGAIVLIAGLLIKEEWLGAGVFAFLLLLYLGVLALLFFGGMGMM